ncbi:hypothetical protein ZZ15_14675 [Listeria monocytogenes]|uniref:Uncharacterized protein n=2 Tax=Listeria monocytogenes TaxID=1639 RepID=A0AAV6E4D7_LISMN|nr:MULTISPECIES: hypothetical protein [Listeria]APV05977.1 hypothetical protein BWI19_15565 [Listeria monocytogenes]APV09072.1 hypothetical protein BWI20_15790 [Listeria monocytogenes]EAA0329812.1 hypothetical protein [Listeria monocytogenes]EAA0353993.1 hypothetical protein [Listeria monocytogenes]EAC3112768.1 hypothetical protein [Listeria monocytogenes]
MMEVVIVLLLMFSLIVMGLLFGDIYFSIKYGHNALFWKICINIFILAPLLIVNILYLWNIELSIIEGFPKKWMAVEVKKSVNGIWDFLVKNY